jgi:hypothetical protein
MCAVMAALLLSELQAIGWRLHSVVKAERGAPSGPLCYARKMDGVLPACVIRVPSALQLKTRGKPSVAPQAPEHSRLRRQSAIPCDPSRCL